MADVSKTVAVIFEGKDEASATAKAVADAIKGVETSTQDAARATGLWQDASGKWRNEAGQFASAAEKAAAGVAGIEGATTRSQFSLEKFGAGLKNTSRDLETVTQPLANLAVGALKFEAGLLTAGAAVTIFATKVAGDFDSSFRQLTTLFDASAKDIDDFRKNILEFSASSTRPIEEITAALQAAVGSGVKYTESLDLIATAEKLAVATRADLKGTTEVLVSTLNSYGASTAEAGRFSDLFFKTIDEGKIEMDELAHSLGLVVPVAVAGGVSLEEVGAALATLTASGIGSSTAVEYLRSLLANIIAPSEQAEKTAASLGLAYGAAELKADGLAATLQKMAIATDGDADAMKRLVGDVGGFVGAVTLTGPQAQRFSEILQSMGDVAGATDAAFQKMSGSLDNSLAKVRSSFTALLIGVGTPLLDEFGGIANAIANIFLVLGESSTTGALSGLVKYIETIVGGLRDTVETVAANLPAALNRADLSGFTRGIDAVATGFSTLFAGINLSTVDGLTKAIEFAGAAFLGLSKFTQGVIESFKPLFEFLIKVAEGAKEVDSGVFQMAGNFAGAAAQINLLVGGINGMLPALEALLNLVLLRQGLGLVGAFGSLATALPGLTTSLTAFGVAAATYFATDKVIQLVTALVAWHQATNHLAASQTSAKYVQEQTTDALLKFKSATGFAVSSVEEANDLIAKGIVVWDEATQSYTKAGEAIATVGASSTDVEKFGAAALANAEKMYVAADRAETLATAQRKVVDGAKTAVPIYDAATGKLIGYEQAHIKTGAAASGSSTALDKATGSTAGLTKEQIKAKEAAQKLELQLLELASNERIKTLEFKAEIDVARIQADAEKVKASFESISVGITSTGDVLKTVFGLFDSLNLDSVETTALFSQIEKENSLRERSFDLQKRLTEAQIENMRAQTQRLNQGDALIKIDGAGLQPQLEAFMWEILRTIQVRVNRDGLPLLLGV